MLAKPVAHLLSDWTCSSFYHSCQRNWSVSVKMLVFRFVWLREKCLNSATLSFPFHFRWMLLEDLSFGYDRQLNFAWHVHRTVRQLLVVHFSSLAFSDSALTLIDLGSKYDLLQWVCRSDWFIYCSLSLELHILFSVWMCVVLCS